MTFAMRPDRWEHGSEHWLLDGVERGAHVLRTPWGASVNRTAAFFGSGRDALRAICAHWRRTHGCKTLFVPSYFCQEVVLALASADLELQLYPDDPRAPWRVEFLEQRCREGDAVLFSNTLGLRVPPAAAELRRRGVVLIEDHTHDPWSGWAWRSDADYALASLRKTLPLPAGGVLWSPIGLELPQAGGVTPARERASFRKMAGMWLKRLYLQGSPLEKDSFRAMLLEGEAEIAAGEISAMPPWTRAMLESFPAVEWRETRRRNHAHLAGRLAGATGVEVLVSWAADGEDSCPFAVTCLLRNRAERDRVRASLIALRIYSAVLWTLDEPVVGGLDEGARELADRMLSLHCDMRYTFEDLDRVAAALLDAVAEMPHTNNK